MRKKIVFVCIILAIVIGADLLIGAVSKNAILNVKDVGVNQTNTVQALFSREADVLILGSSRANHSFDSRVLKDSLGMSCYNAGRDGQNMVYDAMVFFTYLERHVPKLVIMDLNESQMDDSWFNQLQQMNCFYGMSRPLDQIIDENSSWIEKLKLKSSLYRYNSTWQWLLNAKVAKSAEELDGYRPMPVNINTVFKASFVKKAPFTVDKRCENYLERIRKACEENNVSFVLTYAPTLVVTENGGVEAWAEDYSRRTGVPFFDYGKKKEFYEQPELFYDMTHLNEKGAVAFSKRFVRDLKEIMH